jgi:S1-C subfamily serine protease
MNRQQRRAAVKRAHKRSPALTHLKTRVISDKGRPYITRTADDRPFVEASAIFPIFAHVEAGTLELVGTGFYVTPLGHFLTARHVLADIYEKQRPGFMFHMADDGNTALIRSITKFSSHPTADVALGVLEHPSGYVLNSVPTLTTECPQIGEPIVAVAYDKGTHQSNNKILTIWPKYMSGDFEYAHPDGRDTVMLPFPCYRSSINIPGGASGGPVFDVQGRVFGINCTGYEGAAVSYLARVGEILALVAYGMTLEFNGAPTDRTLLQLAQSGHVVFSPKIL